MACSIKTKVCDSQGVPGVGMLCLALEDLSKGHGDALVRFASTGELAVLRRLVDKYGQDVEAMARDRKLNSDQRTTGELSRAIKKAGGFAELTKGC